MTAVGAGTVRSLFSTRRPIDRPIEKVIDYYAADADRLQREVEEYEVTDSVERNLARFLDHFGQGVRTGQVTETGIWVSGFYGSGKSSFTKYLGFALDPTRMVGDRRFLDLFRERINDPAVSSELATLAAQEPTAVIMLDLGSEQLASSSTAEVSQVLYRKVLQWAGYSNEAKLSELEFRLEQDGRYDEFRAAYARQFGGEWEQIHNDPLLGVRRADQLVTQFYPQDYPDKNSFSQLRFSLELNAREQAQRILDVVRRHSGHRNVIFLIDEVGQYVAPRGELILNLDGLARNLKELGQGRVWIVATGQQTLSEIVERAAYNSTELNKLRDRFPIGIELDARDIREITHRRLLAKSPEGEQQLRALFRQHGQALASHTRLADTVLFKKDPSEDDFIRFYPFLPHHFDVMMELVRNLARARGGVGLRSAIRVIQDLLVDASQALPPGAPLLVDQPVGTLATADAFYDTLRADILRVLSHVVEAVDRIERSYGDDPLAVRVGKAIGALQVIDTFPRTIENIAALLYRQIGERSLVEEVRAAVDRLLAAREIGLFDDPQTGGLSFLSERMTTLRAQRDRHQPSSTELATLRSEALRALFEPPPQATLHNAKTVRAGLRFGKAPLAGDDEEVQFQIESASAATWSERRTALLTETTGNREWRSAIAWLVQLPGELDDVLQELARSEEILKKVSEHDGDKDAAQFARAERRSRDQYRERARRLFSEALLHGVLIFRGRATALSESGATIGDVARKQLQAAAAEIYPKFDLVAIRPGTDLAAKFLGVERLDRMPSELDPLRLVVTAGGGARVDPNHPALAEALRELRAQLESREATRLQGNALQDHFALAPFGWSKDATRYVFAGLLTAGEIVLHTATGEVKTAGHAAAEAMKNTQAFGKIGVSVRGSRPSLDELDRAAERLQSLIGGSVMPAEQSIAEAAVKRVPEKLDPLATLPYRLRTLGLRGEERAQNLLDIGKQMSQGDGSDAIAMLGAGDSTFVDDLLWAERAVKALESGGESTILAAREALRQARQLEQRYAEVSLVTDSDLAAIEEALNSDDFAGRLADLRAAAGAIRRRAVTVYAERAATLAERLQADLNRVEGHRDWLRLEDEDRELVASMFTLTLPPTTSESAALTDLGDLLVREAVQPADLPTAERRVAELAPTLVIEPGNGDDPVHVSLSRVVNPATLATEGEIGAWTAQVEVDLVKALREAGKPIRVELN